MLFDPQEMRRQRQTCGLLQQELADKLHVSREMISLYETGRCKPGRNKIIAMAELFGVTAEKLGGEAGDVSNLTEALPLKELRVKRGMSVNELSAQSGISKQTIMNIENGKQKGRRATFEMLARAMGVSSRYIKECVR